MKLRQNGSPAGSRETMFGLPLSTMNRAETVESVLRDISRPADRPRLVVTPNVHHLVKLSGDVELRRLYRQADYILPDGAPLVLLSRLTGGGLKQRVTGADLFTDLLQRLGELEEKVFILGGRPGEEARIETVLRKRYPGIRVEAVCPGFPLDPRGAEAREAAGKASRSGAVAVFVCLGMPKQEIWSFEARERLGSIPVILCVGAALDFVMGRASRAPRIVRAAGMEWLWRALSEPRRLLWRYARDFVLFLPLAAAELRRRMKG